MSIILGLQMCFRSFVSRQASQHCAGSRYMERFVAKAGKMECRVFALGGTCITRTLSYLLCAHLTSKVRVHKNS